MDLVGLEGLVPGDVGWGSLRGSLSRITLGRMPTGIRRAPSTFSISVAHKNPLTHMCDTMPHPILMTS